MKGFFTQGATFLTKQPVELEELESILVDFGPVRKIEGSNDWSIGGTSLILPIRPEVNGYVAIDYVDRKWPDDMGDPKKNPMLFASWSTGHFGPFTYPGSFARACQQAWRWSEAQNNPPTHTGFIRLRVSYCFGVKSDDPIVPPDYDALFELQLFNKILAHVARDERVLCYFNPSGEVLLLPNVFLDSLQWSIDHELPLLDIWSNVRFYNLGGISEGWFLLDTVGMWQLDVPDHEALVPGDRYNYSEVDRFLRNASLYILTNGDIIKNDDTMDGPGNVRWRVSRFRASLTDPPRETLRWFPVDDTEPPAELTSEATTVDS